MARARTIKPGFFKNDDLADCEPLARILYAGLWCFADRDGRLEHRSRILKAEILPYDDVDVDALLKQLEQHGFIRVYDVGGSKFIDIPTFGKHQNPHRDEKPRGIPANPVDAQCQHSADTIQAQCQHSANTPHHLLPITDSLLPITLPSQPDANTVQAPDKHGVGRSVGSVGVFKKLEPETLRNTRRLLEWLEVAAKDPTLELGGEAGRMNVFGSAERALEMGKNPVAFFIGMVKKREWKNISQEQEERARGRLRDYFQRARPPNGNVTRGGEPTPIGEVLENRRNLDLKKPE